MQLSYAIEMDTAHAGDLADLSIKTTDTFAAEEPMCPAMPVVYGENEKLCKVLADEADAEKVIGITQFTHKENDAVIRFVKGEDGELVAKAPDCVGYYPEGWAVPVVTRGRVWVKVDGDIEGGVAKFDIENKVWSSTNGVEVPLAVFKTTATHDGLAIVEIR